ncbi:MAG TPA: efflux RND transporter periplasmic adaptor subunit [Magnetospirillaceae bacterium]|jgi:membrane fusion protein (multidrug efflux system)
MFRFIKRIWRPFVVIVVTVVVVGVIFMVQKQRDAGIKQFLAGFANQKQTVSTVKAATDEWQPTISAVGTFRAVNGSDLSLEVGGIVESINFKSGDDVQGGQVLMHLRSDDDEAHLHSLEALAELAQVNYDRDEKQLKAQAISQAQLDSDAANLKNNKAQVAQQKALVDKKTLRAPFAGHLGIRTIDLGQFVQAGTAVVTLQALDPIYLDFFLPQQALDEIKTGQQVAVSVDTYADKQFTGEISAINPKVDQATRNVQIRATLKNPDHLLLPGMYASIAINTGAPQHYVTLPSTAIAFNPYGSTVFVVETKGKDDKGQDNLVAKQSFVTTGPARGDQIAVLKGVSEGDVVVTAGQNKLHNGSGLNINNSVQPTAEANPDVKDQ